MKREFVVLERRLANLVATRDLERNGIGVVTDSRGFSLGV